MSTEIDTLAHTQLRRVVADRLRSAILEHEIQAGEWLRQEQLAARFGVSQTPVREALKDLAAEGLVEHVPYRGVRVVEFTLDDMLDLYACRSFLEGLAARYAARNITPQELAELGQLQSDLQGVVDRTHLAEHRRLNRRFHQIIYTASRHAYLVRTLNQMWEAFPTMMLSNFRRTAGDPVPQRKASNAQEHEAIVSALQAGNADEAERQTRYHIENTVRLIAAVLQPGSPALLERTRETRQSPTP